METELKRCPCGDIPTTLDLAMGETFRWRKVSGACCGEWFIESRVTHGKMSEEQYAECVLAWNATRRAF